MTLPQTPDQYADYEFWCVYCWHCHPAHNDEGCSGLTGGHTPCICTEFYPRSLALELREQAAPSDPIGTIRH